jgi:hypothetical protein
MPPTASLKFSILQAGGTSTGVLAIDGLTGEMWVLQLRGRRGLDQSRHWARVAEKIERSDLFGGEMKSGMSGVLKIGPEKTSYSDKNLPDEIMGPGGEADPTNADGVTRRSP